MSHSDRAGELFGAGYNCAQSVLGACCHGEGLSEEVGLKVASAFGAGICRRAETCGAVTGALMALGLRHAGPDPASKAEVYARGQEFLRRFEAAHGSVLCRDLLGLDISRPEEMAEARERGLFRTHCPRFVRGAVEILEEMS